MRFTFASYCIFIVTDHAEGICRQGTSAQSEQEPEGESAAAGPHPQLFLEEFQFDTDSLGFQVRSLLGLLMATD